MTLVELMVALAILGLTAALAFSNIGPWLAQSRASAAEPSPPNTIEIAIALMLVCTTSHQRASGVTNLTVTHASTTSVTTEPTTYAMSAPITPRRIAIVSGGSSFMECQRSSSRTAAGAGRELQR